MEQVILKKPDLYDLIQISIDCEDRKTISELTLSQARDLKELLEEVLSDVNEYIK